MLIVFRTDTGAVVENTGTNSSWPEGPPEHLILDRLSEELRGKVSWIRLHDVDDSELIEDIFNHHHHVDPETFKVVIDEPIEFEELPIPPSVTDRFEAFLEELDAIGSNATIAELRDILRSAAKKGKVPPSR
jgi:hypothetical protein